MTWVDYLFIACDLCIDVIADWINSGDGSELVVCNDCIHTIEQGTSCSELDLKWLEFLSIAQPFLMFIFAVCLLKFVWAVGKKILQFFNIMF